MCVVALTWWLEAANITQMSNRSDITEAPVNTIESQNYAPAPDVTIRYLDETERALSEFTGRIIILNFWASWCAPCLVEFPQLLELAEIKNDQIELVFMSVDHDNENIIQFIQRLDAVSQARANRENVHFVWDPEKDVSQDVFQTTRYPETIIIGPDFRMRDKVIGATVDFAGEAFQNRLKAILQDESHKKLTVEN